MFHISGVDRSIVGQITKKKKKKNIFIKKIIKNIYFLSLKQIGQSGGASRWRVCYQRGLPRLVLKYQPFPLLSHPPVRKVIFYILKNLILIFTDLGKNIFCEL